MMTCDQQAWAMTKMAQPAQQVPLLLELELELHLHAGQHAGHDSAV